MNQYACLEKEVLNEPRTARAGHSPASAGPFPLRRAHYFTQERKPLLTVEQQQSLIKLIREGDAGAKRKMIAHNMQLVVDFAKHYANRGLAPLDLIREGNRGLILALEEFELECDLSFLAFATWHICQNIERAIMNLNNSSSRFAFKAAVVRHSAPSALPAVLPNQLPDNIGGGNGLSA
jgi:DNA-directed RNA polymerase sigma subunit (sigma70/sigma32)